jgi:hypothetical protein
VTDVTPQLVETVPRLKNSGLFERVITGRTQEWNRRYAAAKEAELSEGFANADASFRWILDDELTNYETIYFANFDPFTRMLACRFYEHPCRFIWFEDGFSSYVIDYLRADRAPINRHPDGGKIREKVTHTLLYEPRLAMRGDHLPNHALPKIQLGNWEFRELLNYVFDYRRPEKTPEFLFLEQSFRAEGLKTNDLELMRECRQTVGSEKFLVKPHPRNPVNVPFELGLTRRGPEDVPWELFLMNEDLQHTAVITVCSNAALTSRLVFGIHMNTVMLYELFEGKVLWKEDAVLRRYLHQFYRLHADENYYVPRTIYELRHILRYLDKQSGKGRIL